MPIGSLLFVFASQYTRRFCAQGDSMPHHCLETGRWGAARRRPDILPACTTATAHTVAFEFDLVVDLMAIFSNKQAEVSTGEKTCDTTVYKVWKHVAWPKHAVKSWLYVEHPVGWMLFAWHFFNHHLDTEKRLPTTTMWWLGKPQQKTNLLNVSIHSTIFCHQ